MDLTRREFLGYTAGAVGAFGLAQAPFEPVTRESRLPRWRAFRAARDCPIPESVQGYQAVLPKERQRIAYPEPSDSFACCSLVIVASALFVEDGIAAALRRALLRGATVVLESGAVFTEHLQFRKHRRWLRDQFDIRVLAPIDLYARHRQMPYIDYLWPRHARVRDFSRLVPPAEQPGTIIAWVDDLPVAFTRPVGLGTLVYIGSPLGPALWAGDVEAKRWLYAVAHAA